MSIDDPKFVARIRAGEPAALQTVVHAYLGQILRAARGAGLDPQRAEDVTQATFATFIEKAEKFEGRSHVRTWLFGILYKKIAEARRAQQREVKMDDIDEVVEQRFNPDGSWVRPPQPADVQLYRTEVSQFIEDCLEIVPDQQRMAFILREVEGLGTDEICKILGVTRTNLGVLLYRGRNRLRECLETKGVRGYRDAQL
ncbi:sigma-70 family RNA polymerase sigma factor [Acidobacteriia bacterium AH_259_A11_L15]|nr:sigma-70 family RNA polymerase sigma factor [Acidobacteriia bacterium AH_259_A11_L15]